MSHPTYTATNADLELQRTFWNGWNAASRENVPLTAHAKLEASVVINWIRGLGRRDLRILEIGCGSGWLSERLAEYGEVTGLDMADEVIERAKLRAPHITWLAGDFGEMDFSHRSFDVVVHQDTLSHVADQPAFVARIASLLKPGGRMLVGTQNAFVYSRISWVQPTKPGHLRHWVNAAELRRLVVPHFDVLELRTIGAEGDQGILRWLNAPKVYRFVAPLFGGKVRFDRLKERMGLGRSLMLHAVVR